MKAPLEALLRLDLFRRLSESEKDRLAQIASLESVAQDLVLPRASANSEEAAYYFVVKGQVAFAEFEQGKVPAPPKSKKKRPLPVMQQTRQVIALFDIGDFFTNDHVAQMRSADEEKVDAALFTCVHVQLLKIPKLQFEETLRAMPELSQAVASYAESAYYRQQFVKLPDRAELIDFYVREGFEYANAIKVIQSDKCIDCDECVLACEDRHGISRIERFGPQLGLIQFTLNCRTCVDARCLAPCNFDAIAMDEEAHEVVVYDNCVGCNLCAKACPHEAIRMVDMFEHAHAAPKAATSAEVAPKKKKPKRIANKCDHCLGYSDMACISACPTGAIIQIDPKRLFSADGGLIDRPNEAYFSPAAFQDGYVDKAHSQGVAPLRFLLGLIVLMTLSMSVEYLARSTAGFSSPYAFLLSTLGVESSMSLRWEAARGLGRWSGYLGAGLMLIAACYSLRLHVPFLRRFGTSKAWFDFHVVAGVCGPILALLHMDLKVFQLYWVTLLWWAVFGVFVSGLLGRYVYTLAPRVELWVEKTGRSVDRRIKNVSQDWLSLTKSENILAQFQKAQEKQAPDALEGLGFFGVLRHLVRAEWTRFSSAWALRFRVLGGMRNRKLRRTAIALITTRVALDRQRALIGVARRLMTAWRSFHVALSIIMLLLLVVHVALSIWTTGL